jgi:hypothetical protein
MLIGLEYGRMNDGTGLSQGFTFTISTKERSEDFHNWKCKILTELIFFPCFENNLGYRSKNNQQVYSNKNDFNHFLNQILNNTIECDQLVICGDFFDMWRRDLVGVILENADTIKILEDIQNTNESEVNFIVGNHDYYLQRIRRGEYDYDFTFHNRLKFVDSSNEKIEYWFLHGYKFDLIQSEIFYDSFCLTNDDFGKLASDAWDYFTKAKSLISRINFFFRNLKNDLEKLVVPAEERFDIDVLDKIFKLE